MFATHLHEIRPLLESLPAPLPSLSWRRLKVLLQGDEVQMAYKVEEGLHL